PCMYFIEKKYAGDPTNWWIPNHGGMEAMLRSSGLEIQSHPEMETWICRPAQVRKEGKYLLDHELAGTLWIRKLSAGACMVEAVMLWNEPNNLSHWDFKIDPDWKLFAEMVIAASRAVRHEDPELPLVLGGISPIDPNFIELMGARGVLDAVDVVA